MVNLYCEKVEMKNLSSLTPGVILVFQNSS